jgi:hypothetical protein
VPKITPCLLAIIISSLLTACGGWRVSHEALPSSPAVSSRTYDTDKLVVQYADGTSVSKKAISAVVTWADDHITKTITYTFDDGTSNPVVSVVPGVTSIVYAVDSETVVTQYADGTTAISTNKERASLKK